MTTDHDFEIHGACKVDAATQKSLAEAAKVEHREFLRRELERNLEFFIRDDTADAKQRSRALLLLRYVQSERTKMLALQIGG